MALDQGTRGAEPFPNTTVPLPRRQAGQGHRGARTGRGYFFWCFWAAAMSLSSWSPKESGSTVLEFR